MGARGTWSGIFTLGERRESLRILLTGIGGVIVHDCIDMLTGRHGRVNLVEKAKILLVPVFLHAADQDFAVQHVKGGKQRGRVIPLSRASSPRNALFQR